MSTGNDTVLPPADNNQQQPLDTAAAPAVAAVEPVAPIDVDDIELSEAKTAALAEEAGGQGSNQGGAAPGDTTGQQQQQGAPKDQQQPGAGTQPAAESRTIPYERFVEVNAAKSQAEQTAAYWRGIAEARAPGAASAQAGQQQQQAQPAAPTAEQLLATIATSIDALAKQFDDGEITMAQYKAKERELQGQERAIHEEATLAKVPKPAAAQAQGGSDPLYLETLTADLETKHPWVKVFDAVGTDADWGFLKTRAIDNLTARGVDPTKGDLGRYELRKEIASLADKLGMALVGERATAKGIALPGAQPQGQQQQQQQQPRVPQAQARLDAMVKAAGAPPDISNLAGNGAGDPGGVPSDAQLERMSDEEIAAMPVGVRNRLKGIAA